LGAWGRKIIASRTLHSDEYFDFCFRCALPTFSLSTYTVHRLSSVFSFHAISSLEEHRISWTSVLRRAASQSRPRLHVLAMMRAMTQTYYSAFSVFATLLSFVRLSTAGCYWPDRTDRNLVYDNSNNLSISTQNYQPCPADPGQSYSMCCASWNECTSNGLCYDPTNKLYWRESCSDISWESSACIKLFINDTGEFNPRLCVSAPVDNHDGNLN
jgi:hypothetical protein